MRMSHMKEVGKEKEDMDKPKRDTLIQVLHFSHSDSLSTIIVVSM